MTARIPMLALACLVALGGCRGDTDDDDAPVLDDDDSAGRDAPSGGLPTGALAMGSLLAAQAGQPGLYDLPRESEDFEKGKPHHVVLELAGPILELESMSLFSGAGGTELREILERLRTLRTDDQVSGLVLRVSEPGLSMAQAEELRRALLRFRGEGEDRKSLACHTERAIDADYFLLSACDSIGLAPGGEVVIAGAAAMPIHLKGLLDKVGVSADFLHVGAFKGAAEPLTREAPSAEMKETLGAILDRAYETMVAGVAEGRDLEPAVVRGHIDTAVFVSDDALSAGLVDRIAVFEDYRGEITDGGPWRLDRLGEKEPGMSGLMELLGMEPRRRPSEPHVALVYAVGNVVDGDGEGVLGARSEIASRPLSAALRRLAAEDSVKAVVVRVDSGGGSALASELIWNAMEELKAKKPVVVSMGGVAASGGYYLGCGAQKIYALDNTLTGSIGVVGGKLALGRALGKLGITAYPMGRGKRALMWSPVSTWSPDEREAVQAMMQSIYDTFVGRVAAGRDKSTDEVHAVAQGRVWTGAAAREHGLIDEIGGLEDALAEARTLGEVGEDAELEVYPPTPTLMDIMSSLSGVRSPFGLDAAIGELARALGPREAAAVTSVLRGLASVQDAPLQTALFWPLVVR